MKRLLDIAALLAALPFIIGFRVESRLTGERKAFEGASQAISLIPGVIGMLVRRSFYRATLVRCSRSCAISFGVLLSDARAEIGEHVYIGPNCDLGRVRIEDDALLGSGVHILSGKRQHLITDPSKPIRLQGGELSEITIREGAWIGNGAIVMANVGRHSVVGAGAVVVHEVEDYTVVVGNPAAPVRRRDRAGSPGREMQR